jgi:hypothetical protein
MNPKAQISITVKLVNGPPISFKVERTESERRNIAANIESALSSSYVGVELEGRLLIVPTHNIQFIVISPAPELMVKSVVRGATRLRRRRVGGSRPSGDSDSVPRLV